MRLTTTKEKMLSGVLAAERITGKKETLPVLSCVLIEATKDIFLRATNLEAGIEVRVQGDVEDKGIVAVPAVVLSQTLRSISGDKVVLRTEESNLIVESRGTKTLIKATPHEEFPSLSGSPEKKGMSIARELLMRGIQTVSYAASPSMIRPELGSVYISMKGGSVVCVATDSFRLAEKVLSS